MDNTAIISLQRHFIRYQSQRENEKVAENFTKRSINTLIKFIESHLVSGKEGQGGGRRLTGRRWGEGTERGSNR